MMRSAAALRAGTVSEHDAPSPSTSDADLVARVAAGDRAALADLYARHQRPLFRYLCQLTGDPGLAEEVLQDTLAAAWQGAGAFERRASVRTWLFGIARRRAHDALRRRRLPAAPEEALDAVADPEPGPEARALRRSDLDALGAAIARLPAIHREVLVLNFVDGLRYEEIAAVVGVPVGTVRSRLNHAKRGLRALMQETSAVEGASRTEGEPR